MAQWWGQFSLDAGDGGLWHVGPLRLSIARSAGEWRIHRRCEADAVDCRVDVPSPEQVEGDDVTVSRYSFTRTSDSLWLTPRFADRPVVVYPEDPFFVTAGQEIVLFCSTPLWVGVEVGADKTALAEFPAVRPSDTWFGVSTREGELCYATTTAARSSRDDVVPRPHRAVTELCIRNEADDTLQIEKVNLSVAFLSLYLAEDGGLWSDRVTLHRTKSGTGSELEIGDGPPESLGATKISGPRVPSGKDNVAVRAFDALFS